MMTTTTMAMKPVDEMGYLSGVIDKIRLDIRVKEKARLHMLLAPRHDRGHLIFAVPKTKSRTTYAPGFFFF